MARTPLNAKIVSDECAKWTTIVVFQRRAEKLRHGFGKKSEDPCRADKKNRKSQIANRKLICCWLLKKLGSGKCDEPFGRGAAAGWGCVVLARQFLAQRVAFFYAPKILGGRDSRKAVMGDGSEKFERGNSASGNRMEENRRGFANDGAGGLNACLDRVSRCPLNLSKCSLALSRNRRG